LAILLQNINPHPNPKVSLEQYTTPADLAAEILFHACYSYGDIEGRTVVDLGTGTGRLAIGAAILGAEYTVGVDVDPDAVEIAWKNCKGLDVDWVVGNLTALRGEFDTVLMNPPFGTKRPHADIHFLETALKLGRVVYSIHKSSTKQFVESWLKAHNATLQTVMATRIWVNHQFHFHRKSTYPVEVEVYRILPKKI
jgi:putative methylase